MDPTRPVVKDVAEIPRPTGENSEGSAPSKGKLPDKKAGKRAGGTTDGRHGKRLTLILQGSIDDKVAPASRRPEGGRCRLKDPQTHSFPRPIHRRPFSPYRVGETPALHSL